ncbi:mannose-6-phosphate isomerase [Sodiomyces alkalinus F11]|uniref:Mannose-6-phosphate isomerase n=1 Tax=Sodiomyces alkalinus (strain CBS 110278 / VKM F-3762 / F11) TaxID=1314773 RepID=A0A3N2PSL7_SODAK|nr:mannose-6-phosphate isomerase [Sodiomyces alkalinus F11]ROT37502.1 mannose-6-phosphate isomerase [Sodiomyces alkalinus F11]
MVPVPLIRLQCGVNSYEWGKKGSESAAARFAAATPTDSLSIQDDKPYAELWMGTHPNNPSKDWATGRALADLVQENAQLLSSSVIAKYGTQLPFLLKVLSIDKALSIQAHPNKKLAEQLHARDPQNYPDGNHKPEMTIAITPFEGLCGFRPLNEIAHFLRTVEPLRAIVKPHKADEFVSSIETSASSSAEAPSDEVRHHNKTALQHIFASLLSATPDEIKTETANLVALAQNEGENFAAGGTPSSSSGAVLSELVTRLNRQFPDDIGLFVFFFLNYVRLAPGEALFLVADDIHAYLSGDVVECMASSDNVVRAGFTPKFKDVTTLVDMLTYNTAPIEDQKLQPTEYPYATLNRAAYSAGSSVALYDPPIEEFSIVRTVLRGDAAKAIFEPLDGPSIVICTAGRGTIGVGPTVERISEGHVYFVGSTAELTLQSEGGPDDEFITFKAFCEVDNPRDLGEKL